MEVKFLDDERDQKRLSISEIASVEDSQDTVWTHRVMRLPKVQENLKVLPIRQYFFVQCSVCMYRCKIWRM
jgi:hypothetical protein